MSCSLCRIILFVSFLFPFYGLYLLFFYRRFSYSHLAQLKYILPEAILLKKILSHDEMTGCMNHDLQINVVVDAFGDIAKQKQKNGYSFLTTIFRKRLEDFHKDHPKVCINSLPK